MRAPVVHAGLLCEPQPLPSLLSWGSGQRAFFLLLEEACFLESWGAHLSSRRRESNGSAESGAARASPVSRPSAGAVSRHRASPTCVPGIQQRHSAGTERGAWAAHGLGRLSVFHTTAVQTCPLNSSQAPARGGSEGTGTG